MVNQNFEYLEQQVQDASSKIYANNATLESKISTLSTNVSNQVSQLTSSIYPVGSIYMSLSNTCPLEGIIGSWELKNTSILLNKTSTLPVKGNGSTLGLNNDGSSAAGYLNLYRSSYNEAVLSSSGGTNGKVYVTTNSSKSGLVCDITNGLTVYVFERVS